MFKESLVYLKKIKIYKDLFLFEKSTVIDLQEKCVLEETRERNRVELVVHGEVVFTCDIKQLEFGQCFL